MCHTKATGTDREHVVMHRKSHLSPVRDALQRELRPGLGLLATLLQLQKTWHRRENQNVTPSSVRVRHANIPMSIITAQFSLDCVFCECEKRGYADCVVCFHSPEGRGLSPHRRRAGLQRVCSYFDTSAGTGAARSKRAKEVNNVLLFNCKTVPEKQIKIRIYIYNL